jgi:hypothetical protein
VLEAGTRLGKHDAIAPVSGDPQKTDFSPYDRPDWAWFLRGPTDEISTVSVPTLPANPLRPSDGEVIATHWSRPGRQ